MFGGIFEMAKWKLLLIVFIFIIGTMFILMDLPSILNASQITDMPILPVMGMFGACLIVVSVVYFAETLKEGEIVSAFEFGMVGVILGLALVVAWLW